MHAAPASGPRRPRAAAATGPGAPCSAAAACPAAGTGASSAARGGTQESVTRIAGCLMQPDRLAHCAPWACARRRRPAARGGTRVQRTWWMVVSTARPPVARPRRISSTCIAVVESRPLVGSAAPRPIQRPCCTAPCTRSHTNSNSSALTPDICAAHVKRSRALGRRTVQHEHGGVDEHLVADAHALALAARHALALVPACKRSGSVSARSLLPGLPATWELA